jgi:acetate kinase
VIAVLNIGSSSVKADLFTLDKEEPQVRASAKKEEVTDFTEAITSLLEELGGRESITAVGHRVVHGGADDDLPSPVRIDETILEKLKGTIRLAPLHNPPAIRGIEIARKVFPPEVPHYAVFDTAFHRTLPPEARRYAVSARLERELHVRRYGFHGSSHAYVARRAAKLLGRSNSRLITLHLGNGSSAAAIKNGESIDTSMGMTPLEGLVMGTRSGDLDPAIPIMLMREGWSADEIEKELNQRSGLRGLANASDMRELLKSDDPAAKEALAIFVYRIKKYIGAYIAILGGVDAIVFTGGIGEHAAPIRSSIAQGLEHLGIAIDRAKNVVTENTERRIDNGGDVTVLVIPTDEEQEIARQIAQISS